MSTHINAGQVQVERDQDGHWMHPGLPWNEIEDDADCTPWIEKWGFDWKLVGLEGDAPPEMVERYFESNESDCSYWTPTPPEGDGWFLAAIYDTEDGPYAMFLRPKQASAPQAQGEQA